MNRRKSRTLAQVAAAATVLIALAACSSGQPSTNPSSGAKGQPYVLGFTSDFSSNFGYLGKGLQSGLNAYWDALNASGGINGHPVHMIALDDASQPDRGTANVTQLITQDGAIGIAGVMYSAICSAATPILTQYKVPEMCGVVSSDLVKPADPWVYATTTDQASYAAPQVEMAQQLMKTAGKTDPKVAILYATGSAAIEQWATAVTSSAKGLGWNVVDTEKVPQTAVDMSTQLTKIIAAKPDVLILGAGNDAWVLAGQKQLTAAGDPFPIVSYDVPSWTTVQKLQSKNFYYVSALAFAPKTTTQPGLQKFFDDASADGIDPNGPYVIRGYLQAAIFKDALTRCGWPCSGEQLQKALDKTKLDTHGLIDGDATLTPTNHTPVVSLAAYQWLPGATAPKIAKGGLAAGIAVK